MNTSKTQLIETLAKGFSQSQERSFPVVIQMVKEIAEAGAFPIIVGGDHLLMYPDVVALTQVYGKGNIGVVHFDAQFDGEH
jgi:agmatinase